MESNKKIRAVAGLLIAALLVTGKAQAISLDDIQLWGGSGTNRAALVIEWNSPEIFNYTTVPAPVANKTMVWGYRFNGNATGTQMLDAILAADPKLYVVVNENPTNGTFVDAIGYNLSGNGNLGVVAGGVTNYFIQGLFTNAVPTNSDSEIPLNSGDLYWGGYAGPKWLVWTEQNDTGGFYNSPNRGSSTYWNPSTYAQGQWDSATNLDHLPLTNGSWIGFSVAADGGPTNSDPNYITEANVFTNDEQAPPSPDGTYVAYVPNTNDFAVQVLSSSNLDSYSLYSDPTAALGPPTLQFFDPYDGAVTDRVSIIDPPFNVTPEGSNVITAIENGGEITVEMGRKVYASPSNPYGVDLMVYGYSFFDSLSGVPGGIVSDGTDLSAVMLTGSAYIGHQAVVSVSQDGTNWVPLTNTQTLFPDEAYRWDDTNASWTEEEMNANKPLNPYLYTNNFAGQTVAGALDQFTGASGGSDYNLQQTGLPWIQYVCLQPAASTYTVIDAIAAANPVVVGDALSITPDNIAAGNTNLFFQRADNCVQNQIAIGFSSVNELARISTVSLSDFLPFAPVAGDVSSAYQIQALPVAGTNAVEFCAEVSLRAGDSYTGDGSDLRVFQWACTNWTSEPFTYNAANHEVILTGVTNYSADSAFVVSQIVRPVLSVESVTNKYALEWTTVPNCPETLERSTNFTTWPAIYTFTATNAALIKLTDTNTPPRAAFYRVQVTMP
jgi:hypothetical protein